MTTDLALILPRDLPPSVCCATIDVEVVEPEPSGDGSARLTRAESVEPGYTVEGTAPHLEALVRPALRFGAAQRYTFGTVFRSSRHQFQHNVGTGRRSLSVPHIAEHDASHLLPSVDSDDGVYTTVTTAVRADPYVVRFDGVPAESIAASITCLRNRAMQVVDRLRFQCGADSAEASQMEECISREIRYRDGYVHP